MAASSLPPLHQAAETGDEPRVRALLLSSADINGRDKVRNLLTPSLLRYFLLFPCVVWMDTLDEGLLEWAHAHSLPPD